MPRIVDAAQQLTDARTKRLFVGGFTSQLGTDQSNASQDGTVGNPTGRYQVLGQYGYAVEGHPTSQGQGQHQKAKRKPIVFIAIAAVAVYFLAKHA